MSFPKYEKYKDSEVEWLGEVPAHWEVKRFKYIFCEREERSTNGSETLLSVSAYTGVTPRSEVIDDGDFLSRAESLEGYKVCYVNDLVVNIMLAWNRGLAVTKYEGIVSPAYCVFSIIDESDPRFLNYLVRTDEYTLYFKAFSSGVIDSRLRIYPDTFGRLFCSLPTFSEQIQIAEFLDRETAKIDELVAEQQRLIDLLKEKRQSVISCAVTRGLNPNVKLKSSRIEWIGDVPEHWDVKPLKSVVFMRSGEQITANDIDVEGPYPVFGGNGLRGFTAKFTHDGYFPLIGRQGALCGNINYGNGQFWASEHAVVVTPVSKCSIFWLGETLRTMNLGQYSVTAAQPGLSVEAIGNLRIPFPDFKEQQVIADFLNTQTAKFDTLTSEAQRAIDLLQERRTAIISAAVTGKIDVRQLNKN